MPSWLFLEFKLPIIFNRSGVVSKKVDLPFWSPWLPFLSCFLPRLFLRLLMMKSFYLDSISSLCENKQRSLMVIGPADKSKIWEIVGRLEQA